MKLIKFTLSAPLQSWGEDARWDYRTTSSIPSKSAIIGLLSCCLGYPRGDERIIHLNEQLMIAIRADRPGRVMTDYHTVHPSGKAALPTASGEYREIGEGIVTPKQYLQDARFTVFLQGNEDILASCFQAMKHPKWAVYLGRKSCVPSVPVIPEWLKADSLEKAVVEPGFSGAQVEMDTQPNDPLGPGQRIITRRDAILRADRNEYAIRWVKAFAVKSGGEASCT